MSIHIFSFDENSPRSEQQLARLQSALAGLRFSGKDDFKQIGEFLFTRRYDVSITLSGNNVISINQATTKSKYEFGSLTTIQRV